MIALFFTAAFWYADFRVGSRLFFEVKVAWFDAFVRNWMNLYAAATFFDLFEMTKLWPPTGEP